MSNEAEKVKRYRLDRSCVLADHVVMSPMEVVQELNALAKRVEELESDAPSAEAGAVPEGWKLVPIHPTESMFYAGSYTPTGIGGCPPSVV